MHLGQLADLRRGRLPNHQWDRHGSHRHNNINSSDHVDRCAAVGCADVTQVDCPSAAGCYALGTGTSGTPELLAGAPGADKWVRLTPASTTFNSLSSIACPTSTTCEVSGSPSSGLHPRHPSSSVLTATRGPWPPNSAWTPTFTADGLPSTLKSVGEIMCPDSTQCLAISTGDSTSASDPTIFTTDPLSSLAGQASTWIDETSRRERARSPVFPAPRSNVWPSEPCRAQRHHGRLDGQPGRLRFIRSVAAVHHHSLVERSRWPAETHQVRTPPAAT